MIRWGGERAHGGPWRADRSVALLVPVPDGRALSAGFARRCLAVLAAQGYRRVVTSALRPEERLGFLEAGFEVKAISFYERKMYSSTLIRERMVKDQRWKKLVPKSVAAFIEEIDGINRIQDLTKSDRA